MKKEKYVGGNDRISIAICGIPKALANEIKKS